MSASNNIKHTNKAAPVDFSERDRQVAAYCSEGFTQKKIASKLGISYQRVQQIEKRLKLKREPKPVPLIVYSCQQCGVKFKDTRLDRVFCSSKCHRASKKVELSSEELERRRAHRNAFANDYYHNVLKKKPNWQSIVRERNYRAHLSKRNRNIRIRV